METLHTIESAPVRMFRWMCRCGCMFMRTVVKGGSVPQGKEWRVEVRGDGVMEGEEGTSDV